MAARRDSNPPQHPQPDGPRRAEVPPGEGCAPHALARRVELRGRWSDLALPYAALDTLRAIALYARHRTHSFRSLPDALRGAGACALFSGPSRRDKTLAAEVLARDLGFELQRVDPGALVSRYIGETEKNLARLFGQAQDRASILLFDEADALFGKRSQVRDSHDRYANIELSYLLQRVEAFPGLTILSTSRRPDSDPACLRRLHFVVDFPHPDGPKR